MGSRRWDAMRARLRAAACMRVPVLFLLPSVPFFFHPPVRRARCPYQIFSAAIALITLYHQSHLIASLIIKWSLYLFRHHIVYLGLLCPSLGLGYLPVSLFSFSLVSSHFFYHTSFKASLFHLDLYLLSFASLSFRTHVPYLGLSTSASIRYRAVRQFRTARRVDLGLDPPGRTRLPQSPGRVPGSISVCLSVPRHTSIRSSIHRHSSPSRASPPRAAAAPREG
ncbi:hypothetical protein BJ912DRAFT_424718 [Pholiota molesta]|nr:hypothetical protein BJ912DRAFT_424718 [Pholiota molesta]